MVKLALQETGNYEVEEQNESSQALLTARRFRPDLIFLDVMMPDVDGGDIAQQIEADPCLRGTPIIFLTSLVSKNEATSAPLLGGYHFIAKPARMSQIVSCADEILRPKGVGSAFAPAEQSGSRGLKFIRRFSHKLVHPTA